MSWTKEALQEVVQAVVDKAVTDEQFRALCVSNIHEAIQQVSGKEVPAAFKINVIDNTGYHLSLTLPPLRKEAGELSDTELETVAGGSKGGDVALDVMEEVITTVIAG